MNILDHAYSISKEYGEMVQRECFKLSHHISVSTQVILSQEPEDYDENYDNDY